ncbi:MAG TPA: 4'-phosphopantetheinyl transferase superfamily protein [Verrucomicrobiae bacterium]|nr:4'-phosphopantetheinyl transferase superfamily protein [Verrucomicrobiae bacterium]
MSDRLFPHDVMTLLATPGMWEGTLLPEEEACISRAVPKRRREFTAGRVAARELLARFGVIEVAIPAAADRTPVWPAGIVGSISHCDGLCGVAIARAATYESIGLDVEGVEGLPEETIRLVCPERELARAVAATGSSRGEAAKFLFSAKEAFYKCWFPVTEVTLDFHDVEVDFEARRGAFGARVLAPHPERALTGKIAGRFTRDASHVAAGVALLRTPG